MKKRSRIGLIIYLILIAALSAAVIVLLIRDIKEKGTADTTTILRTALIFATIIISVARVFGVARKRPSTAMLRQHYAEYIGNAFSGDAKREKAFFRAVANVADGNYPRAVKQLEKLTEQWTNRQERFAILFFRALCHDELGMYRLAAELYESALSVLENSTAASNLGICYQQMGDFDRAIESYERAIEIDSTNAYPYNNIAQLYIRMAEYEKAIEYADLALARNNSFYQALSAKSIALAVLGRTEEYEKTFARAIACGANKQGIEYMIRSLTSEHEEE